MIITCLMLCISSYSSLSWVFSAFHGATLKGLLSIRMTGTLFFLEVVGIAGICFCVDH